jgi:hypothetical protein
LIKRYFLEDNKIARKLLVGKTAVGKKAIGGEVLAPSSTAEMSSKRFGGKGARGETWRGGGGRIFIQFILSKKCFRKTFQCNENGGLHDLRFVGIS